MILTNEHLEAIRTAAATVDYGKITIMSGTENKLDIIIENRIRLPKETAKLPDRKPLLAVKNRALRPG